MCFADIDFYKTEYLKGRAELIPSAEFEFWAHKATNCINRRRIQLEEIPEYLKICTCQVAEALFMDSERQFMALLPSQSVGGYNRGAVPQSPVGNVDVFVNKIIYQCLCGTDLHNQFIYRGV